ncbi:MAG: hypothetical protein ACFFCQ_13620, partial [Promethearchaeota archaeon]
PQLDVLEYSHVPQTSVSPEEEPVELSQELLDNAKRDLAIFHPFSRASILPKELMTTAHASYIEQTRWSLPVRMAILKLILVDDKSESE